MVPAKLQSYVKEQLKGGYSPAAIKEAALGAGWKEADIDAALAATKTEMPQAPPGTSLTQPLIGLLTKTIDTITAAKTKSWGTTILTLVVSLLLMVGMVVIKILASVNVPLLGGLLAMTGTDMAAVAVTIAVAIGLVLGLGFGAVAFFAYLYKKVIVLLGGKGDFYGAFTALSYGAYVPAIGIIISAVLGLAPGFLGAILGLVGGIIVTITLAIGFATSVRALMEMFEVQLLVPLVACVIIGIVLAFGFSTMFASAMSSFLGGMMGGTGTYDPFASMFPVS